MIALWLAAGLLASAGETVIEAPVIGGGWGEYRRHRRRASDDSDERAAAAKLAVEEALRQAQEALEAQEDRDRYERRLEALAAAYAQREVDRASIREAAAKAVANLYDEIAAEFDMLVIQMQVERDEDDAIAILLLALEV